MSGAAPVPAAGTDAPGPEADARARIRDRALTAGFDAVGFCDAADAPHLRDDLTAFLAAGYQGDMGWMAETAERRSGLRRLWPEARAAVALGLTYAPQDDPLANLARPERGTISVYARNRDYHDLIKKRLKAVARWMADSFACQVKVFVDTAPVMEKPLAARAGLGWQGKHTNLVSRDHGSWLFLGEIVTDLALAPDGPGEDRCGSCARCLAACPTDAFPAPYRLDARRCISYLTIEHRGPIPAELRPAMGNRIYGCDDCLAVCPWNKFAAATREAAFQPRIELTAPMLADLAGLDEAGFRRVFAGSPIKRIGRDRFLRNVLIALGNCGDADQAATVRPHLDDPAPLVRAMAVWAMGRLLDADAFADLHRARAPAERDPDVAAEWRR